MRHLRPLGVPHAVWDHLRLSSFLPVVLFCFAWVCQGQAEAPISCTPTRRRRAIARCLTRPPCRRRSGLRHNPKAAFLPPRRCLSPHPKRFLRRNNRRPCNPLAPLGYTLRKRQNNARPGWCWPRGQRTHGCTRPSHWTHHMPQARLRRCPMRFH